MPVRQAKAQWEGDLREGRGNMKLGSGAWEGPFSFASRMENGTGTNPEELIGAAHAGCFSMALSLFLGEHGHKAEAIRTTATVELDPQQLAITRIELETEAEVAGLDEAGFRDIAEQAKKNCPVSKALDGVQIVLKSARLLSVPASRA